MEQEEHKDVKFPLWRGPTAKAASAQVKAFNSLTGTKTDFAPSKAGSRQVGWYICGPTVYDSAHLGHARAYVSFDIVRRVLEGVFGFSVKYVMNVTDIDDKIIVRARRNHLLEQYQRDRLEKPSWQHVEGVIHDIDEAFRQSLAGSTQSAETKRSKPVALERAQEFAAWYNKDALGLVTQLAFKTAAECEAWIAASDDGQRLWSMFNAADGKVSTKALDERQFKLAQIQRAYAEFLAVAGRARASVLKSTAESKMATAGDVKAVDDDDDDDWSTVEAVISRLIAAGRDVLGNVLDKLHGAQVTDLAIFQTHARRFELEFFNDMRALGVRDASVVTRVSEYVPKIVDFVQGIIDNKMAYESVTNNKDDKGNKACSVFFDTAAFSKTHVYGKLSPHSVCHGHDDDKEQQQQEGEGSLSASAAIRSEKKAAMDFVLWKRSKPGEPKWPSPWGDGRPGWHIECSAMASDVLGDNLDIHSGGEDLRFPHHDNELAQSEARWGTHQWVNHFWHAGHLHIEGRKMSKSLKNFITVREALAENTGRQLRLLFLFQPWDQQMNFSRDLLKDAVAKERTFKEFLQNVEVALRRQTTAASGSSAAGDARSLSMMMSEHDRKLDAQFADAQDAVYEALADNFQYHVAARTLLGLISDTNKYLAAAGEGTQSSLLRSISEYVVKMLDVFGVELGSRRGQDVDARQPALKQCLDVLAAFRDKVRVDAKAGLDGSGGSSGGSTISRMLALCDELRDDVLPAIGVRLEDRPIGRASVWKLDDPAVLLAERAAKQRQSDAVTLKRLSSVLAAREKDLDKVLKGAVPACKMFLDRKDEFSQYDSATGLPTHGKNGVLLSASAVKLCKKQYALRLQANKELETALASGSDLVKSLEAQVASLRAQIAQLTAATAS